MAKTRTQIKSDIQNITGKSNKDSFIETLCDAALKEACMRHNFNLARSTTDVSGTTGDTSFSLPSGTRNVISIAVMDGTTSAASLNLKSEEWYNEHVGIPEQYNSGWPDKGSRFGNTIQLDRPIDSDYDFRVRYTSYPTFASDATECPIELLDTFLVYYCSAMIFSSIEDDENYKRWMRLAVGNDFSNWNGGAFGAAVVADEGDQAIKHTAMDIQQMTSKKPTLFTDDGTAWFGNS